MLDTIDLKLLKQCNKNPEQSLKNTISPLLGTRNVRTLYDRMRALEAKQLIEIDRSQKKVAFVKITPKGEAAITGREIPAPQKGARSP